MSTGSNSYVPIEPEHFEAGSAESEIWMDACVAALEGYASATWSKDGKAINPSIPSIVAANATQAADLVLAAYRSRTKH